MHHGAKLAQSTPFAVRIIYAWGAPPDNDATPSTSLPSSAIVPFISEAQVGAVARYHMIEHAEQYRIAALEPVQ